MQLHKILFNFYNKRLRKGEAGEAEILTIRNFLEDVKEKLNGKQKQFQVQLAFLTIT